MNDSNTTRLVAALLLCCALSAGAATAPRDERLELAEDLARIEEVLADDLREWEVLRAAKTEDLIEEREVVRDPVRYLRIVDVLIRRLEPRFTKEEQRRLLGDPFATEFSLDGYFTFDGLEYKDPTLGSMNRGRTLYWNDKFLPRPDQAKPDRDGLPVTQANLSREDLREVQRAIDDLRRLRNIRFYKRDRYASLLPFKDLARMLEAEPDTWEKQYLARHLLPQIPKGASRKQVVAWAGEPLSNSSEGEEYMSVRGYAFIRYEKGTVATIKFMSTFARFVKDDPTSMIVAAFYFSFAAAASMPAPMFTFAPSSFSAAPSVLSAR